MSDAGSSTNAVVVDFVPGPAPEPEPEPGEPKKSAVDDAVEPGLLAYVLSAVLDGPTPVVNPGYYATLAAHVAAHDPEVVEAVDRLADVVRGAYRSAWEHRSFQAVVSLRRQPSEFVERLVDDDCAMCLKPLRGPARLVRVRARGGDPATCGHFFHAACVAAYELHEPGPKRCPTCRADLGDVVAAWDDTESAVPRF